MQLAIFFGVAVFFVASFFLWTLIEKKIPQLKPKRQTLILTIFLAFFTIVTVNVILYLAPQWTDGTRIAWIGMRSYDKKLTIGGSQETATVAWSNGSFSPKLTAELKGATLDLQITGSEGFVREEKTKNFLNGEVLKSAEINKIGSYGFRLNGVFRTYLEILDGQNQPIVELYLPISRKKDRVFNLISLVEKESDRFTPTNLEQFNGFEAFRRWSQNVRILLSSSNEVRILVFEADGAAEKNAPYTCENPCKISVLWSNNKITAVLGKEPNGENLMLQYLPPFRNLSPPPPDEAKGNLVITGQPRPGEYAFTLPLGKKGMMRNEKEVWREVKKIEFKPKPEDVSKPPEFSFTDSGKQELLETVEGQTSVITANGSSMGFMMALITDLPSIKFTVLLSLIAFFGYIIGLFLLAISGISKENFWGISGLTLLAWIFLAIRIVLAVRYALDPTYLDELAVSGVTWAFVGLAVMPLFLIFVGRLFADKNQKFDQPEEKLARNISLGILAILFVAGSLEFWLTPKLWGNLPTNFIPQIGWSGLLGVLLLVFYLAIYVWRSPRIWKNSPSDNWKEILKRGKRGDWIGVITFSLLVLLFQVWELPALVNEKSGEIWSFLLKHKPKIWRFLSFPTIWTALVLFSVGLVVSFGILKRFGFGDELLFTHTVIPLIFCWLPVLFWLASKKIDFQTVLPKEIPRKSNYLWKLTSFLALLTIFLPIFFVPWAIGDAGSMYAYTALFLSLSFVLLKRSTRTRVFGAVVSVFFAIALFGAIIVYLNTLSLVRILPGEVGARMLVFKEGTNTQHLFLVAGAGDEESALGLNIVNLQNVYEHLWENQAITHESGWLGAGLGNAPVRASQVRQDTIQYDSVFSFYVIGDYGVLGGMFLLLLYACPVLVVFLAGKNLFDTGYAVAFIVVGTFCLEALTHAAMNVGFLPFTGRDLPLLAVNSFKGDLLRWLILFAFAVNAMFWRYQKPDSAGEDNELNEDETDVLEDNDAAANPASAPTANPLSEPTATAKKTWQEIAKPYLKISPTTRKIFCLTALPIFLFICIFWTGWRLIKNTDLDEPFTWNVMLKDARWAIDNGCVVLDEAQKLKFDEKKCQTLAKENLDSQFIGQQINRFNSLTTEEKFGQGTFLWILRELGTVDTQAKYDAVMKKISQQPMPSKKREPNLFSLEAVYDDDGNERIRAVANSEMNVRVSFKERKQADIPKIGFSGGPDLIGAVWVKGKWKPSVNPDPNLLSWTDWMGEALSSEGTRLTRKSGNVNDIYKGLTLDQKLHQAALGFIDDKGRTRHSELLQKPSGNRKNPWHDKLPPRVALTVMRLSSGNDNGAVLALGSFPRAVSGQFWQTLGNGQILPPIGIIEKVFPKQLKSLYSGDRNFDNSIVMGSSTKPIFAAAALAVHPNLAGQLTVSGSSGPDEKVFGIKIADEKTAWKVFGSKKNPVDFDQYLTESNNRYQVALGFLGLAKDEGGDVKYQERSGSLEFIGKGKKSFLPDFPDNIVFSSDAQRSEQIKNLNETMMAKKLRNMFGVNILYTKEIDGKEDYTSFMYSFWTKNENDDVLRSFDEKNAPTPDTARRSSFLPTILPARVNMRLNQIEKPRDYVSLLLGGGENQWSNVQAAAAFGSCVTGRRILPHIVKNDTAPIFYGREDFVEISKVLRPGLHNVVFSAESGTAYGKLKDTNALSILTDLDKNGYKVFAKTGTLAGESEGSSNNQQKTELTTRIILTIVKFKGDGHIERGLVFSMVAERVPIKTSTEWLGSFIVKSEPEIRRLLSAEQPSKQK